MASPDSGAKSTPSAPTVVRMPSFGGSWTTRTSCSASISKRRVVGAPATALVYAAAAIRGALAGVAIAGCVSERRVGRGRAQGDVDAQVLPVGAQHAEAIGLGVEGEAGPDVAVERDGQRADEGGGAGRGIDAVNVVGGREAEEVAVGGARVDADEAAAEAGRADGANRLRAIGCEDDEGAVVGRPDERGTRSVEERGSEERGG